MKPYVKPVKGSPGYWVTDTGEVWSTKVDPKGRKLRTPANGAGYPTVRCGRRTVYVHQLVAEAFMGPSEGRVVRHVDGNKLNPHVDNLIYGSQRDNARDHALGDVLSGMVDRAHSARGEEAPGAAEEFKRQVLEACLI